MTTNMNKEALALWSEVISLYLNHNGDNMSSKFECILSDLRQGVKPKVILSDDTIVSITHYDPEDGMFILSTGESCYLDEILTVF